jgi:hypothetical protein
MAIAHTGELTRNLCTFITPIEPVNIYIYKDNEGHMDIMSKNRKWAS